MDDKDKIIAELKAEVEKARERVAELAEARTASLFLLEDLDRTREEMERTQLELQEETEITRHLLMISEATATITDVDKLMEQVINCAQKITGSDVCLSYLWDDEGGVFRPSKEIGLPATLSPVFRVKSILEEAASEVAEVTDVVIIQDVRSEGVSTVPEFISWIKDMNIGTMGIIPLRGRISRLGLIIGIYLNPTVIDEKKKRVIQGISHQVSVALEQARLFREGTDRAIELSNKMETIQAMNEIDRSILSTLKSDEILETATRLVARIVPCDSATVALVDRERGGFVNAAGFGAEFLAKGVFVPFKETSTTEVVEAVRPQYEGNLAGVKNLPLEARLLEHGFLSHIRVPLIVRGEAIGVLNVGTKRPSAYTTDNLSTLEKLAAQISVALENSRLLSDLEELFIGTVKSLSSAIDAKSKWTAGHSERVTKYALDIGREIGLSETELKDLELAGLLHDVGKIGTYESILDKPGKLTDEERTIMQQHPVMGAEILAPIKQLKDIIPGVKYHHEFYDGTGYPDGLKGEGIPLHARILTVADTVDAMGADRPYRKGRSTDVIIAELKRCSGTQFDPKVVEAFLKVLP